jgi:hypothetical protein
MLAFMFFKVIRILVVFIKQIIYKNSWDVIILDISKLSFVVLESFHFVKKLYINSLCMLVVSLATNFY